MWEPCVNIEFLTTVYYVHGLPFSVLHDAYVGHIFVPNYTPFAVGKYSLIIICLMLDYYLKVLVG